MQKMKYKVLHQPLSGFHHAHHRFGHCIGFLRLLSHFPARIAGGNTPCNRREYDMKLTETRKGAALILAVSERVDSVTSPELERRISELIAGGERMLIVDLSGLSYVSSAGLRVFLSAAKKLKAASGKLLLCSLGGMVKEVFIMSGFADILAIYDTLEKALNDA